MHVLLLKVHLSQSHQVVVALVCVLNVILFQNTTSYQNKYYSLGFSQICWHYFKIIGTFFRELASENNARKMRYVRIPKMDDF